MKKNGPLIVYYTIGASALLLAAFLNGFPLVYSDTSTYLASGFELEAPFDRPITYGLFLRLFSLNGWSLWPVVMVQALLIFYLIDFHFTHFLGKRSPKVWGLSILLLLGTGLSWTVCQVMPDIFTPIALLSLSALLWTDVHRGHRIFLFVLFFISVAMHVSHVLLFGSGIILTFLIFYKRLKHRRKTLIICFALVLGSILLMGSAIAKSRHVFFMGSMVERGILKSYLDKHCGDKDYALCAYKDSLPEHAYAFVWDESSPLYKLGGWKACKSEFESIIHESLREAPFIGMHISTSITATARQLICFNMGDGNGRFREGTTLHARILQYLPGDASAFLCASQQNEGIQLPFWNRLQLFWIGLSAVILILLSIQQGSRMNTSIIVFLLLFLILNAWVCGTFANVIDRLGCKVMWMIPFILCLSICVIKPTDSKRIHESTSP